MWIARSAQGTTATPSSHLKTLPDELRQQPEEPCFAWAAGQYALGKITLEEYLDLLFAHLAANGPRHTFDASLDDLEDLFQYDLVGAAVKASVCRRGFKPLSDDEISGLKRLCLALWSTSDPEVLETQLQEQDVDLGLLSGTSINIALMVCYARRCPLTLSRLLQLPCRPPTKTVFDMLPGCIPEGRRRERDNVFQHAPATPADGKLEMDLWTRILNSKWLHCPVDEELAQGIAWIMAFSQHRESPDLDAFLDSLISKRIKPGCGIMETFLCGNVPREMSPCTVDQAENLFYRFPLPQGTARNSSSGYPVDWTNILVRIAKWPMENPDRLAVMAMAIDAGIDQNFIYPDLGGISSCYTRETPLVVAARRGDVAMVELLVERGADKELTAGSREGLKASQIARRHGHMDIAAFLERS